MRRWFGWMFFGLGLLVAPATWAQTYAIDANHSSVEFRIRHLFSYVRGNFDQFEGTFDYEPGKPEAWKANAVIQAASINTRVAKRDDHLRSRDFFEVETYPTITFAGMEVTDVTAEGAKLHGLLTIHGVQKPVILEVAIHGTGNGPQGETRSGFTATTTVHRKDFGLMWNKVLEAGQLMVGEDVEITVEVEGVQKQ